MHLGNFDDAIAAAERLAEVDCGVCESFGNHLLGLAVGIAECPTNKVRVDLVEGAVESAEHIRNNIVGE
jgi:hypothetical protein